MTNNVNHIKNEPELNREMQTMISGTSIAWSKAKEEIWPEMLEKMEGKASASHRTRVVYLQFKRLAVAAALLILLGIPAAMLFYTKTIHNSSELSVDVLLPDHSKVTVNTLSVLSYKPLLWRFARTVKFEGEGFFEVQKGKKFEVASKKGKTIVLGTQFIVYSRSNDYNVTCVSGKVKVVEASYQNEAVLTAGQKALLKPDGTFEIQEINTREDASNKTQNQVLEEELNDVLSTDNEQAEPIKRNLKQSVNQPGAVKQQVVEEPVNDEVPHSAKEQNNSQVQTVEEEKKQSQQNGTAQGQIGSNGNNLNQIQEKVKDQSTGTQVTSKKLSQTLTSEQKSILQNKQMSKEERYRAFMESLSDEQRKLLEEEKRAKQSQDDKNVSAETDNTKEQQKMQVREQVREGAGKETQQQQMQQNRENAGQGNEKSTGTGKGN
jgi:transmembrane sensor